jgi:hypothetical protein
MSEEDHEQLADELDQQADKLEREQQRLKQEIGDVRDDWQRKRQDEGVPGAVPPDREAEAEAEADDEDTDGAPAAG